MKWNRFGKRRMQTQMSNTNHNNSTNLYTPPSKHLYIYEAKQPILQHESSTQSHVAFLYCIIFRALYIRIVVGTIDRLSTLYDYIIDLALITDYVN